MPFTQLQWTLQADSVWTVGNKEACQLEDLRLFMDLVGRAESCVLTWLHCCRLVVLECEPAALRKPDLLQKTTCTEAA